VFGNELSQCKFVHHRHRMDQRGNEPGSPALKIGHMHSLRQAKEKLGVQYKQCCVIVSLFLMSDVLKIVKRFMFLHLSFGTM
jgi:hypothetical protein